MRFVLLSVYSLQGKYRMINDLDVVQSRDPRRNMLSAGPCDFQSEPRPKQGRGTRDVSDALIRRPMSEPTNFDVFDSSLRRDHLTTSRPLTFDATVDEIELRSRIWCLA